MLIITLSTSGKKKEKEEESEYKRTLERLEQLVMEEYDENKKEMLSTLGTPDKSIIIEEDDFSQEIHIFEKDKVVYLGGFEHKFSEIKGYRITNNSKTIKGKMYAKSSSDTGSMLGRAIAGQMLFGDKGAVIGGATGSRDIDIYQSEDTTYNDFTIYVQFSNVAAPVLPIKIGNDEYTTQEVVALLDHIIERNNSQK